MGGGRGEEGRVPGGAGVVCPALPGALVLEIWTKDGTGIARDGPVHFQSLNPGRMTGAETGERSLQLW